MYILFRKITMNVTKNAKKRFFAEILNKLFNFSVLLVSRAEKGFNNNTLYLNNTFP